MNNLDVRSKVEELQTHLNRYNINNWDIFDLPGPHTIIRRGPRNGQPITEEDYRFYLSQLKNLYNQIIKIMETKIQEDEIDDEEENEEEDEDANRERHINILNMLKRERDRLPPVPVVPVVPAVLEVPHVEAVGMRQRMSKLINDYGGIGGKKRRKKRKTNKRKTNKRKTTKRKA